ncbi:Acyl-CoA dehydrogenase [Thermomonospora echinospora]|uniref:Acyl-CoA dehydrogenase n=1 Tax=Thermomonospora echinospora TaxID=1992 RepID=A0A1H6DVC4_9ACTN|nr:acyl-CoA dehydrogenase family protein [Thermomonospora echinospora]SEG88666.1 Acyl-CoA dehydrogenase [Thermomonospora echinospora]
MTTTVGIEKDLREALGRLLAERCDHEHVAALADGPQEWDRDLWAELAAMGLPGLVVPPEHGGEGMGFALAAAAQEELGRRLAPVPAMSTTAVQAALLASGDSAEAARWLPRLTSGEVTAAVAAGRTVDGWAMADDVRATRAPGGWRLSGRVPVVADAAAAGLLLVAAGADGDPALFLVDATVKGVRIDRLDALDPTRPLAGVRMDGVPAGRLAGHEEFTEVFQAAERAALVLLAADAVGVAAQAMDMAVEYAGTRRQFGRAIGSFQAISHRCADMLVAVESSRALVAAAAASLDDPSEDTAVAVDLAAAHALETAVRVTGGCVQVHGGMGFTWEHPAHRYLRRAKAAESLVALPDRLRDRAAAALVARLDHDNEDN